MSQVIVNKQDLYYSLDELQAKGFWKKGLSETEIKAQEENEKRGLEMIEDVIAPPIVRAGRKIGRFLDGVFNVLDDFNSKYLKERDEKQQYEDEVLGEIRYRKYKEELYFKKEIEALRLEGRHDLADIMVKEREAERKRQDILAKQKLETIKNQEEAPKWENPTELFHGELSQEKLEKLDYRKAELILRVHIGVLPVIFNNFQKHGLPNLALWLVNNYKELFSDKDLSVKKDFLEIFPFNVTDFNIRNQGELVKWVVNRATTNKDRLRYMEQSVKAFDNHFVLFHYPNGKLSLMQPIQ